MPTLENSFLQLENVKIIDSSIPYSKYIPLQLSVLNTDLSKIDLKNPELFEAYPINHDHVCHSAHDGILRNCL